MSRGGAGRGQGRKPLPEGERKVPVSVRLPPDVANWIYAHAMAKKPETTSAVIERVVRKAMAERDDKPQPRKG